MKASHSFFSAVMIAVLSTAVALAAPPIGKGGGGGNGNGNGKGKKQTTTIGCESVPAAPTISGTPASTVTEGESYAFQPAAADANCEPLTFAIAGRPSWASFDTATGRLHGTPGAGTAGLYTGITISVSDGVSSSALPAFSITVKGNMPPTISGTPATQVLEGQPYDFRPSASDPEGQALRFSIANKPAWAVFSSSTGQLSGTPSAADVKIFYNIAISVSDGLASSSLLPFNIEVKASNRAPTISGTPPTSAQAGLAYAFKPTASDPDGDKLSFSISNRPAWAIFDTATGQLSGTPTAGDVGSYSNILISVSDGQLTASLASFSIAVQQVSNGSATLSWQPPEQRTDGSQLTNLAGYRIRYGTATGSYTNVITLTNPGLTSYVIENLPPATYYFVMAAFDNQGAESANTSPVSKTVM